MTTHDSEPGRVRPFADILRDIRAGQVSDEAATAMQQLVAAVREHGKKGTLTLQMLELVQHFQAVKKVTFQSSTVLANGDRRLTYVEETDAGAGTKQQLEVPSTLELGIAPFEDSTPYVVNARFRYRIQGGALYMGFILDNAVDVLRDAVKTVVASLQEELGIVIMRGTPE